MFLRRFSGSIEAVTRPALLGLCLALSASARAAPELALLPFEDPRPFVVERIVANSLSDTQLKFWPSGAVRRRLAAAGIRLTDAQLVTKTTALLRVPMVLRERRFGGMLVITLQAADGRTLAQLRYPARKGLPLLRPTLDGWLPQAMETSRRLTRRTPPPAVAPARPPPETPAPSAPPAVTLEATPAPPAAPTESPAPSEAAPPLAQAEQTASADHAPDEAPWPAVIDFELGGGTLSHWLNYNQDLFNALGNYTLVAGPLVAGSLAFYPGALATRGVFAHLGLIGEFNHTAGLASSFQNQSYPTLDDRWTAGLRIRIPISIWELGVSGEYGEQDFRMGNIPGTQAPPLPNYTYGFVQAGLDVNVQLGVVRISADGAYVDVVEDGIATSGYFPHAEVGAVATGLHLGVRLWEGLELRLRGDYQRYFYNFNPDPGDPHVAGGAVDQYLAATLELGVIVR